MRFLIIASLSSLAFLSCAKRDEPIPQRSNWGIGMRINVPMTVCSFAKGVNDVEGMEYCNEDDDFRSSTYGIYWLNGYRAVNDTITQVYFSDFMDTIYIYVVDNNDTIYYNEKDLMDLSSYELQSVNTLEDGTQVFGFVIDIDSTSFY